MKKEQLLIVLLVLTTSILLSQPTITYNGNAPEIGDVFYFSNNEEALDPGSSGPNQTWDYSSFNVIYTNQATIMNPAITPFVSGFPGCNQVFYFDGTNTYIYYDVNSNALIHYGEGFDTIPPLIIHFSDPLKEIEYPFSYNDNFTDDFFSDYTYAGMTTHRRGTSTTTADAWGSITTPEDTYNSVLRVKSVKTGVDSIWMDGIFIYATNTTSTYYSWHTGSSHTPVMTIASTDDDICGITYCNHFTTSSLHVINPLAGINSLRVSPNPANDFLQILFNAEENSQIQISVIDLNGREILQNKYESNKAGDQHTSIYLDKINAGLYFVKISNGKQTLTKKIIVR